MLTLIALAAMLHDPTERTPSIFRCSTAEADSKFFAEMLEEDHFDQYCVEPRPSKTAMEIALGKIKFIKPSIIDTPANLKWRNLTIDFVKGKISPKAWLDKTKALHETVHFLSSPKTKKLRVELGTNSRPSVFAEMLLTSWPGKPCLTADDTGGGRYLPGPGAEESWILAMNDYLGPMLSLRHERPYLVTGKPKIIRADAKPGMLIFSYGEGKTLITFFINNGPSSIECPQVEPEHAAGIQYGLDLEGPKPRLMPQGFLFQYKE